MLTGSTGYATNVVGCGTIIATTGTFTGNASITGCECLIQEIGERSDSDKRDRRLRLRHRHTHWNGDGLACRCWRIGFICDVWRRQWQWKFRRLWNTGKEHIPQPFRVLFAFPLTLLETGSGTFVATQGYTTTIAAPVATASVSASRPVTSVIVYLSYCPTNSMDGGGMLQLASNASATSLPSTSPSNGSTGSTSLLSATYNFNNTNSDNPLCNQCPNSVGICCPPTVSCSQDDGKCPQRALELSHNTINGYLIAQVMNSTAPVAGRKKVRALVRPSPPSPDDEAAAAGQGRSYGTRDDKHETHVEEGKMARSEHSHKKRKAHRKQF